MTRVRLSPQRPRRSLLRPPLQFTPYAWAKLVFLRDAGGTEVGGFGVSSERDLLLIEDVQLVQQRCGPTTVVFDDASVADYFDRQIDLGVQPERCGRIWIHTHPGDSALPSATDERTFERSFQGPDWALMFILARGGASYARVRFRAGPGGQMRLPVQVAYEQPFEGADYQAWLAEYEQNVTTAEPSGRPARLSREDDEFLDLFLSGQGAPWW